MEYEIIFYHSGKTAECERLLEKRLSKLGLSALPSTAATDPASLASELQQALSCSDIVIIIGGLDGGRQSTDSILSQILSAEKERPDCEKLVDDNDNIAYFLKAGDQCIVVLPDETEVMEGMLDKRIMKELIKQYSLTEQKDDTPPIETVTSTLRKQLSEMERSHPSRSGTYADQQRREMKKLLTAAVAVGAAGVLLLLTAVILLLFR